MPSSSRTPDITVEATVTSKGQITLPSELRKRLGIKKGSRSGSPSQPAVLCN